MMRALYSGVAGLKTHMQRLDVIGNNIANVNTYGFKSSRATFRDMYYQQIRGASVGTNTRGGINPSAIGYGSQLSSVDLMMGQSGMTNTGNQLDIAITGEGFLQVQDPDGNIYYTKAGMLDIDTNGRLVDTNGNFVLGTSASSGQLNSSEPGRSVIQITVDPVEPAYAELDTTVLGRQFTIKSDAQTNLGNVSFTFSASKKKADGTEFMNSEPLEVVMENGSTNISVRLNEDYRFNTMADLTREINNAITVANGGEYEGGQFTFELEGFPDRVGNEGGLTGGEIAASRDNSTRGTFLNTITLDDGTTGPAQTAMWQDVKLEPGQSAGFTGSGNVESIEYTYTAATGNPGDADYVAASVEITVTLGDGSTYIGTVTDTGLTQLNRQGGGASTNDYMAIRIGSDEALARFADGAANQFPTPLENVGSVTPAKASSSLGLGKQTWTLDGGTVGGPQSYENLTGISIGADGVIIGSHPVHGRLVLGRIDLANFANPMGLAQAGNTYFTETENSGAANYAVPGEDGTGAIKSTALEMSNVDLAQEFSDMIVTQRGYQANSRIITVSDTILEELINLKR